jgi:hypothetical protein
MRSLVHAGIACALLGLAACASVDFERRTPSSGTFSSSGLAFTFLSMDVPSPALDIARGNAADAQRPNLVVEEELVIPHLGPLDWLLDIVGVRWARVSGTWGFPPEEASPRVADATPGSNRGSSTRP